MSFRLGLVLLLAASCARAAVVDMGGAPPLAPLGPVSTFQPGLEARAAEMAAQYALQLPAARAQAEELFAGLGEVTARAKSAQSVTAKLNARGADVSSEASLERAVRDGVGVRLTLSDTSPEGIERLVARLSQAFENGSLRAQQLSNFRAAEDGRPYLEELHMARLAEAAGRAGLALRARPRERSMIPAGYTAIHMNVVFANGAQGEIQIRGPRVHDLAEREHAAYDARRGKRSRLEAETGIEGLDEAQNRAYLAYLSSLYAHARKIETLGADAAGPAPVLPKRLGRRLDLSLAAP